MTIVTTFFVRNSPVLLGDLLLTGPEDLSKTSHIPTIGDTSEVFPEGSGITLRLKQKIILINENLVIGWFGNYVAAKSVITRLRRAGQAENFSHDSLTDFFQHEKEHIKELEVGFLEYIKEYGRILCFAYTFNCGTSSFDSQLIRDVTLAGSGSSDFEAFIRDFHNTSFAAETNNSLVVAGAIACTLSGEFIQREINNYSNSLSEYALNGSLYQLYGGGYEVACLVNGSFKKVSSTTYIFWSAIVNKEEVVINMPYYICKYEYLNDLLVICSTKIENLNNKNSFSFTDNLYFVPPIYRELDNDETKDFVMSNMNSLFMCHFVLTPTKQPDQTFLMTSRINCCVNSMGPFQISKDKTRIVFNISEELIREFAKNITNTFKAKYNPC